MECAHLDLGGVVFADELHETLAHLVRSLVREGHRAQRPRRKIAVCNEMCYAHREDLGLATPGPSEDLQRNLWGGAERLPDEMSDCTRDTAYQSYL